MRDLTLSGDGGAVRDCSSGRSSAPVRALTAACLIVLLVSQAVPLQIVGGHQSGDGEAVLMTFDVCNAGTSALTGSEAIALYHECPGCVSPLVTVVSYEAVTVVFYRFTSAFQQDPPPRS